MSRTVECETLIDLLQQRAAETPNALAIGYLRDGRDLDQEITFVELERRSRAIAAELQARGLAGQCALLLYPTGIEFVCAFFGCLFAGVIAVPAPPPENSRKKRSGPRLKSIIDDCQAALTLTCQQMAPDVISVMEELASPPGVLVTDDVPTSLSSSWLAPDIDPQAAAYLQYSSGSTSSPKGIEISQFNLLYHCAHLQKMCGYDQHSVTVTWMPNFHDYGLVEGIMEPIFNGTPCYLMSPISFVRRPKHWLEAIARFRATHSQGPNFAYELCVRRIGDSEIEGLDLSCWRVAGNAAEPIHFQVMVDFHEKFQRAGFRWHTFCPAFGLGEATLLVTHSPDSEAPRALQLVPEFLERGEAVISNSETNYRTVVSCGRTYVDTRLAIVNPETRVALPEGKVGEIWVKDPSVARGYWGRSEETAATFQAHIAETGEGPFMRTGDLGFLWEGELFVTGRWKDLIIIRGSNHSPQDIEWTVQSTHPALQAQTGAAFSISVDGAERLVILQEVDLKLIDDSELDSLMDKIVQQVVDDHEIEVYGLCLLRRGTIPKTASAKVQRRASRQLYLEYSLEPLRIWKRAGGGQSTVAAARQTPVTPGPATTISKSSKATADNMLAWLRQYASLRINSQLMDERRSVSPHIILDFGNQGLFGLQVPQKFGGQALSYRDTLRVLQQIAAIDFSLATLVFLSNTNGLRPLINYAQPELQQSLLPSLAAGRHLAAFTLSEPEAGSNVGGIKTTATRQPDGSWLLSGTKRWNGSAWCNSFTVIARERDASGAGLGVSAFVVRQSDPGVTIGPESLTMGLRAIVQNSVHFDQVPVPPGALLGKSGQGFEVVNDALSVGRLCTATVCLGGTQRALQLLLGYVNQRDIATGRSIDNPNTQYQLSQLVLRAKLVAHANYYFADELDRGETIVAWKLMAAKVAASRGFNDCTATAMQLMGGRGYMENNEIPRLFRDARSLSIGEGPNESLIGFLGQPAAVSELTAWLPKTGHANLVEKFTSTCREIEARCGRLAQLSSSQQQQWSQFLTGSLAAEIILAATVPHQSADADLKTLQDWSYKQVDQRAQQSLSLADCGPTDLKTAELQRLVADFQHDIGLVHQHLPGEDLAMDPLVLQGLQAASPATNHSNRQPSQAAVDKSADTDVDKRRRLAQLLKGRIGE